MNKIWDEAMKLWLAGGWAMIPLALNALVLCFKAVEVRMQLGTKGYMDNRWGITGKLKGAGHFGKKERERAALVAHDFLLWMGIALPQPPTSKSVSDAFSEVRVTEMAPIDRDMKFIKVAMAAAPLWGLLGTVSGMLATFSGLAGGGGADQTMDTVAAGISEALITTQTGLMVALPGYFLHYYLSRHRERFDAFLAHLETSYSQHLHHLKEREMEDAQLAAIGLQEVHP